MLNGWRLTKGLAILFELQHIANKYISTLATVVIILHPLLPVLPESLTSFQFGPPYLRLKFFFLFKRELGQSFLRFPHRQEVVIEFRFPGLGCG